MVFEKAIVAIYLRFFKVERLMNFIVDEMLVMHVVISLNS
jgi:hypothetical protein